MRKNRILSALLAGMLLASSMPVQVFALPGDAGSSAPQTGNIAGDSTIASSALLNVVIPTNLDFVINPLELPVGISGDNDQIISTGYAFVNKSNMDVQLKVTPTFASSDGVTIADSPNQITNAADEDPAIYLELLPAASKPVLDKAVDGTVTLDSATFTSAGAVGIAADGSDSMYFKLKALKSAYAWNGSNMTYDDDLATVPRMDTIAFKFGGKVSQMSAWQNKDLKINLKYEFSFISNDTYTNTSAVYGTYGMVAGDMNATETGPRIILNSQGKFSIEDIGDRDFTGNLYYIYDETNRITVSRQDIIKAISNNTFVAGGYTLKPLKHPDFYSFNPSTLTGELTYDFKKDVSNAHIMIIAPLKKYGINTELTSAAISKDIVMDTVN